MRVLMFSPGFPVEMPFFTRGLATVGAEVIGLGDSPEGALPKMARDSLSAYVQVGSWLDEDAVLAQVRDLASKVRIDRIECLWEPYMVLAARMREMLGIPGLTVAQTIPFRDKEIMKRVLEDAGIRMPRHGAATTIDGVLQAVEHVGYPLIIKPIDGAGSADTYRIDNETELENVLPALRGLPEVSVEEFIEGIDCTFDALCSGGEIHHYNVAFYRPRALLAKENEWVSPQTVVVRDMDLAELQPGKEMGFAVLEALEFDTGFTHMEWYRTPSGEAVFGEIAARPPGAQLTDLMNYACDVDFFTGWAEAVCFGRFSQTIERKYNAAWIFKRAQGQGRIQRIEGLESILADMGQWICALELNSVGNPRRNWKQVLKGDGMVIVRHPDLQTLMDMADRVGTQLQMYAG